MNQGRHPPVFDEKQELNQALEDARQQYIENRPGSAAAFERSVEYMPGGNTRTVLFHNPFPLRIVSGEGSHVTDADGFRYLNLLGEYTAGLFGHNNPIIRRAINRALDNGISLSGHNLDEIRLAELVCDRFPSIEKVRFTNSGTEANLMAISTARYVTARKKVLVFEGGYHGGLLYFRGGGIPINAPFDYVLADFNDSASVRDAFARHANEIACALVEPVQGSGGCLPANREFLETLRSECTKANTVLIFDEVMTSRLSDSGGQGVYGITPDMTTLGKYVGGGLTFGAFGGGDELMNIFDPRESNAIPHAGTFNNNPLTMAAGAAAMGEILDSSTLEAVNSRGDRLRENLNALCSKAGVPIHFTGMGSLIGFHGTYGPVNSIRDLADADDRILELLFLDLLESGFYMARRGFIALMLTVTDDEIESFADAFRAFLRLRAGVLGGSTGQ